MCFRASRFLRVAASVCLALNAGLGGETARAGEPADSRDERAQRVKAALAESDKLFQESLAGYCQALEKTPGVAPIPVQLGGWPSLQVPSCSVLGLVLLGEGNTLERGRYAAQLKKLYQYVLLATDSDAKANASHQSWLLAFGILFLSEVHRVNPSPELRARIAELAKLLESGRVGEKGWRHGLTPAEKDYGPFVAVTLWCAAALSAAKEQGAVVDEAGLKTTFSGLRRSAGKAGGGFYFVDGGTTVSPGRAGGLVWVLRRYAGAAGPEDARALAFLLRHLSTLQEGHASGVMNFAWAALGVALAGGDAPVAFWDVHLKTILNARRPVGSFPPQQWRDLGYADGGDEKTPQEGKGTTWPDHMYGDAWATAWMLLVWQSGLNRSVLVAKGASPPAPATALPQAPVLDAAALQKETAELLAAGKADEAARKLDELLGKHPNHAWLHRLRALAHVPGLAAPVEAKIDPQAYADKAKNWNPAAEASALAQLAAALKASEGKGLVPEAFDAQCQLLIARVHAKRFVTSVRANPAAVQWVPYYQAFVAAIKGPLSNVATQGEAALLTQAVTAHLPLKPKPGDPPPRR